VAPNLLEQRFEVDAPGEVLGTDITYIPTGEGWLYLTGVKDFASMEIVGYAMGARMTKELVHIALEKAMRYRRPLPGCIHHSDRGSQYCAHTYQDLIKENGMRASMLRKGNCYDNAPTESFWGTLKQEMVYHRRFKTRLEA
jgi:putative transposase